MQQLSRFLNRFRSKVSRASRRRRRYQCEPLEVRTLLASVMDSGTTLRLQLEANEQLQVVSNGTSYEFTSSNSVFSDDGVTESAVFSAFGSANLTLNNLAQHDRLEILDTANDASVEFVNGGTGQFEHHVDILFDALAHGESVTFSGVAAFGDNSLTIQTSGSVLINAGARLSVRDGDIDITAVNQSDGTIARRGIDIAGATISTSGSGDIQLTGTGVTSNPNINRVDGIRVLQNAVFESTSADADAGGIHFNGTGGGGTSFEFGINIEDATVNSVNGDVTLTGMAGVGAGHSHYGMVIKRVTFESTGAESDAANISFDGTGGTAEDFGIGTLMEDVQIRTLDGDISIAGRGGSGSGGNNQGARIKNSVIQSTGSGANAGKIAVSFLGGMGTHASGGGIIQEGTQILSVDGPITVSADAGPSVSEHGNGGVSIFGVIRSSGEAPIDVNGTGATGGSFTRGVEVIGDTALIESIAAPITINGIAGNATNGNGDGVELRSGAIVTSVRGDISIRGTAGTGETGPSRGVRIISGAQVRSTGVGSDAGDIIIDATGGAGTDWNLGLDLNRGAVEAVDADIRITGRGGRGTGGSNRGVAIHGGTVRSTGAGEFSGNINIRGFGGSGVNWNSGVTIATDEEGAGEISSIDGAINVAGTPNGTVSGFTNQGVWVGGPITTTGTGDVEIEGTGNAGTSGGRGVRIQDTTVETFTGNLTVRGVGGSGSGNQNEGVVVDQSSTLATSDGRVSIVGTSGTNNSHGVEVYGTADGGGKILARSNGNIEISASGLGTGVKADFKLYPNAFVGGENASGNISIFADTVDFDPASSMRTEGDLVITPFMNATNNRTITLGGTASESPTDLNLTDAELATIASSFRSVIFGDSEVTKVTIESVSLPVPVEIRGQTIQDKTGFDVSAPSTTLNGVVTVGDSTGVLHVNDATLASGSTLELQFAGTLPGEGRGRHDQVNAVGNFTIEADVQLNPIWVPGFRPDGGQEVVIVRRDASQHRGAFHGLPEGSTLSDFFHASISYRGGDGNDISLTFPDVIVMPNQVTLDDIATAGVTIFGSRHSGEFGGLGDFVQSVGDVDGDGFGDFAITARRVDGPDNARYAGRVYLVYGAHDLPEIIDVASPSVRITSIFGSDSGDHIEQIDAGDFNNDGHVDLLIGAAAGDGPENQRLQSGEAYVVWGSSSFETTIRLDELGERGVTIYGAEAGDLLGESVSAIGDFNDDGFDDFALGAPEADGLDNLRANSGEIFVVYGGSDLSGTIDLAAGPPGVLRLLGKREGDEAGISVAGLGDGDGDQIDDLVIGAHLSGSDNSGAAIFVSGSDARPNVIDLNEGGQGTRSGRDQSDWLGRSVAGGGDINGDGLSDALAGATKGDGSDNSRRDAGETVVRWGRDPQRSAESPPSPLTIYGSDVDDHSGVSVSIVGDLNADGYDDIAIGSSVGDGLDNLLPSAGEVYIILGGPTLPAEIDLRNGDFDFVLYGADMGDNVGNVAGAGDVNGDGIDDLLIGAHDSDSFRNSRPREGEAYVIFGDSLFQPAVPVVTGPTGRLESNNAKITWNKAARAASYELWLERIGDDNNPVVNPTSVDGTSYDVGNLVFGRYRAWVRANRGDGSKSSWRANTFSVTASTTIQSAGEEDGRLDVSWDAVPGATGYRVYVSNVTQRQNPVVDTVVTETSFRSNLPLTFGLHRVWVQPIGPGTAVGSWSRHADYNFAPQPISPQSTLNSRPTFEWTSVDGVESVQLYIQTWPNVVVNQSGITGTSYTPDFDLDTGFYRWWVRATAENGRTAGWSDTGIVSIGSTQITGPATDVVDGFAEIEWQTLDGAGTDPISYHIYLYSDTEQRLIRRQADITETSFRSEALADGDYRVWVQPRLVNSRVFRWSRPYSFRVETPSSVDVQPVEPTTPTFDAAPTFRWTAPAQVQSFNLFLTDGETVIYETGLTVPEWTPSSNLAPGPWKWRVQGVDALGQVGSWSAEGTTDTSARAVVTAVDISGAQATVRWSAVLGADRYVLQIDVRRGEQGVVREDDLTATSFTTTLAPNELYRVWVRAIAADGSLGTWSYQFEFETR